MCTSVGCVSVRCERCYRAQALCHCAVIKYDDAALSGRRSRGLGVRETERKEIGDRCGHDRRGDNARSLVVGLDRN